MRFIFKTSYAQDIRLAKHGGHVFWYSLLWHNSELIETMIKITKG